MTKSRDLLAPILGFTLLAGTVVAVPAAEPQSLNLAKECSEFTAHSGDHCTIVESNLSAIPVGSRVYYYGPVIGPAILSSAVLIDAGNGVTAIGYCNVDLPKSAGACTFWGGSGALAGFQALVNLTIDAKSIFHWDGSYSITPQ